MTCEISIKLQFQINDVKDQQLPKANISTMSDGILSFKKRYTYYMTNKEDRRREAGKTLLETPYSYATGTT